MVLVSARKRKRNEKTRKGEKDDGKIEYFKWLLFPNTVCGLVVGLRYEVKYQEK